MMDVIDSAPTVAVDEAEYVRLLGFPQGHVLDGRARELAEWARGWYSDNGRPWVYARATEQLLVSPGRVEIDGQVFRSARLERVLREAGAHAVFVVAVSAGPELERAAHDAWLGERPDEYFFLETFGSAVVEHLTAATGARLCAWAEPRAMAVLPHYSPGYPEWDIGEQRDLARLFDPGRLPGTFEVLESGMLRPKKSLLAAFGVTNRIDRVRPLTGLLPCETCSFGPCAYRRAPYRGTVRDPQSEPADARASQAPAYGTSVKALRRWASERLTFGERQDGGLDAVFRYEGSTCSNMGRSLHFEYRVTLGPRSDGFPIRAQTCRAVDGDDGFRSMCEYVRAGDPFIRAIGEEMPLLGRPLGDVLSWQRPQLGPGCLCESSSRQHKWGLVLETIHYALTQSRDSKVGGTVADA